MNNLSNTSIGWVLCAIMNVYYAGMSLPMARVNGRATFARAHWPHPVIYARTSLSSYLSLMVTTIYVTTYYRTISYSVLSRMLGLYSGIFFGFITYRHQNGID